MPATNLVAEMESTFGDSPSAELFDLRAREVEATLREPSNIVRRNQNFRLSTRIRFTGPGLSAITPNRIRARFFLESMGTATEVNISPVVVTTSATEYRLQTDPLDPGSAGLNLRANTIYKLAATVDVENPDNGVQRMAGYIEGGVLQIRETTSV